MRRIVLPMAITAGVCTLAAGAFAHHGWGRYDAANPVTVTACAVPNVDIGEVAPYAAVAPYSTTPVAGSSVLQLTCAEVSASTTDTPLT